MLHRIGANRPDTLSVAFIPEWHAGTMSPCASIRMHAFLRSLEAAGKISLEILVPDEIEGTIADVFAWHRIALTSDQAELLQRHAGRVKAALVYDLDDNLLEMDGHPEKDAYLPLRDAVRASCNVADLVWCSTTRLSDRIRAYRSTRRVEHQPNVLDPSNWASQAADRKPSLGSIRLLYMGTRTHEEDFRFLSKCIDAARKQKLQVELHVIGVRTSDQSGPEWLHTVEIPAHVGASYPAFVNWVSGLSGYDAGVAPLLSSPFNDCKSHVKVLDYALLGLPSIASLMPAYADELRNGVDAILAENSVQGWVDAFSKMMDPSTRAGILTRARALVDPARFQDGCASRLESLAAAAGLRGSQPPSTNNRTLDRNEHL